MFCIEKQASLPYLFNSLSAVPMSLYWGSSRRDMRSRMLTGQSVPIFRCDREMRINADRHIFDDQ
jgi:hypothetical protein